MSRGRVRHTRPRRESPKKCDEKYHTRHAFSEEFEGRWQIFMTTSEAGVAESDGTDDNSLLTLKSMRPGSLVKLEQEIESLSATARSEVTIDARISDDL